MERFLAESEEASREVLLEGSSVAMPEVSVVVRLATLLAQAAEAAGAVDQALERPWVHEEINKQMQPKLKPSGLRARR